MRTSHRLAADTVNYRSHSSCDVTEALELYFTHGVGDCETVGIPPLMSRKTLGILDGGRGGPSIARGGVGVLQAWIRAEHNILDC